MELDVRTIYKVGVLVTMRWFKKAGNIIKNSQIHMGLIGVQKNNQAEIKEYEAISAVIAQLWELILSRMSMDEDKFISPKGENNYIEEEITGGDLVNNVLQNSLVPEEEVENGVSPTDDDLAEEHTAPTPKRFYGPLQL